MPIKYEKIQNKEWLTNELQTKPIRQIAQENDCSYSAIIYQTRKMGIAVPKRTRHIAHVDKSPIIKNALKEKYPKGRFGELASNWRGGISIVSNIIRSSTQYKDWRTAVFTRDGFVCVRCGSRDQIEADHKRAFSVIIRENNIHTMEEALACAELWNIGNGQTLCHQHHIETETHSQRLKPIDLDKDSRTEVEKKIDKLEKSKDYYQKRNWQLQNKILPKLRQENKELKLYIVQLESRL